MAGTVQVMNQVLLAAVYVVEQCFSALWTATNMLFHPPSLCITTMDSFLWLWNGKLKTLDQTTGRVKVREISAILSRTSALTSSRPIKARHNTRWRARRTTWRGEAGASWPTACPGPPWYVRRSPVLVWMPGALLFPAYLSLCFLLSSINARIGLDSRSGQAKD